MKRISILLASAAMLFAASSVQAQTYNMKITRVDGTVMENTESGVGFLDDGRIVVPRYEVDSLTYEYHFYNDTIAAGELRMVDFQTTNGRIWENNYAPSVISWADSDFGYASVMHLRDMLTEDMTSYNNSYNWYSSALEICLYEEHVLPYVSWEYYVHNILTCTDFIRSVDLAMASDSQKAALAEALTVRALLNLDFARMYEFLPNERTSGLTAEGNNVLNLTVPLLDENLKMYGDSYYLAPRVTKKEISDFIQSDLQRAESLISYVTSTSHELPHQDVINGLRARLALWNEDYAAAQRYAFAAINKTTARLMTTEELLSTTTGFNDLTPWMWGVQQDYATGRNLLSNLKNFTSWMSSEWEHGYTFYVPPMIGRSLYDRISDTDVRKLLFIAPSGTALSGKSPTIQQNSSLSAYTSIKFRPANGLTTELDGCSTAYPLMRLEEMYFIAMESMAHQGQLEEARALLRSFMELRDPSYSINATTADALLEEILLQKRIEFWGEGQTFFDVKRTDQSVIRDYEGTNFYDAAAKNSLGRPWWMNLTISSSSYNNNLALYGYGNPQEEPTALTGTPDAEFILDEPAFKQELEAVPLDSIVYFSFHGKLPARLAGDEKYVAVEVSNTPDFSPMHLVKVGSLDMVDGSEFFKGEINSSSVIGALKAFLGQDGLETTGRATAYVRALCGGYISNTVELPVIIPEEVYTGATDYSYAPLISIAPVGTIDCEAVAGEDLVQLVQVNYPENTEFFSSYNEDDFIRIGYLQTNSGRSQFNIDKQGCTDNRNGYFNSNEYFFRNYVAEKGQTTITFDDIYLYGSVIRGDLVMSFSTYSNRIPLSLKFNAQAAAESAYSWSDVAMLKLNSEFNSSLSDTKVTLQRAIEDKQLYRILSPYQRDHNLMFRIDEQGVVTMSSQAALYTDGQRTSVSGTGQQVQEKYFLLNLTFTTPDGQQKNEEWISLGMGTYREDLLTGVYGVDNVVYEVEVQMSNTNKLRMVNPYGAAYPYNESGDFDPDTTYYLTFDISNPNAVLMDPEIQELGLHWGYGAFSVYHRGSAYAGKLEDGVLTFPQNAFYVDMSEYNKGSFYGNVNKMFALALPGSRIKDYSAEVFSEKVTETDNVATLTFKITKGEDVSYARYAFAEEATLDNVISTLRNGGGTTVSSNNEIVA